LFDSANNRSDFFQQTASGWAEKDIVSNQSLLTSLAFNFSKAGQE